MSGNQKSTYGVRRLIKEFPNKNWSKRGVEDFLKRLRTTESIEGAPGSGRPRTTRTAEKVDAVGDLVQSQENQPQADRSTRQISRELGIPQTSNWRWVFLFSFAVNVNEQRIIAFLTGKRCYLNLGSKVRTQIRWGLAKVIVKNKMSRFYGSLCT